MSIINITFICRINTKWTELELKLKLKLRRQHRIQWFQVMYTEDTHWKMERNEEYVGQLEWICWLTIGISRVSLTSNLMLGRGTRREKEVTSQP